MQRGVSLHRSWHPAGNIARTTDDIHECIFLSKASNNDYCLVPAAVPLITPRLRLSQDSRQSCCNARTFLPTLTYQ